MKLRPSIWRAVALLLLVAGVAAAQTDGQNGREAKFLRLERAEDDTPRALETAIVRYVPRDCGETGPTVDLVAAVHVADKAYYEELNRRFKQYDVVLYELVAPPGTQIPQGGVKGGGSPVSALQLAMTRMLELEFQLNGVDYTPKNFVHADMSPQQFAESMRRRGESMLQIFFRMMGYAMAQQNNSDGASGDVRLLMALFDKDRALALKRVMSEQFQDLEGSLTAINGPDGSTLITERNKVAFDTLREQIKAGHKKLAIFYGAGHMPDFGRRLRKELALVPLETTWLCAWNMESSSQVPADSHAKAAAQ